MSIANRVHSPGKLTFSNLLISCSADLLIRGILGLKQIRCDDTGSVGNGNHSTGTNGSAGRSDDCRCSVGDEGDDGRIGASDHEDADISASNAGHCRKKNVADSDEDQGADDMLRESGD